MKQIALPIGLESTPTFETFIAGANAAALAHLRALAAPAAPVYLWGPPRAHGGRVAWFEADRALPWGLEVPAALIVLDACDELEPARQHAAFALFVEAATAGTPVLAAGRLPPVDLPLREDLRTRLGWGHVFALQPLSDAEARAALRREADRRGLFLPDEVMDHLLTRFARDLKHLHRMLDALDAYALLHKRAPTLPLLRQMLADRDDD